MCSGHASQTAPEAYTPHEHCLQLDVIGGPGDSFSSSLASSTFLPPPTSLTCFIYGLCQQNGLFLFCGTLVREVVLKCCTKKERRRGKFCPLLYIFPISHFFTFTRCLTINCNVSSKTLFSNLFFFLTQKNLYSNFPKQKGNQLEIKFG